MCPISRGLVRIHNRPYIDISLACGFDRELLALSDIAGRSVPNSSAGSVSLRSGAHTVPSEPGELPRSIAPEYSLKIVIFRCNCIC